MIHIKKSFEQFVIDNTPWLTRFINMKIYNKSLIDDIVQEIFIKAFRAYDKYYDIGKERHWLMRIAKTTICDYLSERVYDEIVYETLTESDDSVEEQYLQRELVEEILITVGKMTAAEQSVFKCRFLMDLSVEETSYRLSMPLGSVKSKTHYIKKKIRNEISYGSERSPIIMKCSDYINFTLGYVNGHIKNRDIIDHIESCVKCRKYTDMFKKLLKFIPADVKDKINHVLILIPDGAGNENSYIYTSAFLTHEQAEENNLSADLTRKLALENNWEQASWRGGIQYDNEGNITKLYYIDNKHYYDKKYYQPFDRWYSCGMQNAMFCKPERDYERQSQDDPNLIECRLENNLGPAGLSSLLMAIPKSAKDIHIIRGNGIIECDNYNFAYVSRHVAEGERIVLEYTYKK